MVEKAIYYRLSNSSSITTITNRIYNMTMPQEVTMPAIVFQRVSTLRDDVAHSGAMGLAQAIIQISIYSETNLEARNLSDAVRKLFHVYKGTVNTVEILLSQVINEYSLYENDTEIYHSIIDLQVKYREAII